MASGYLQSQVICCTQEAVLKSEAVFTNTTEIYSPHHLQFDVLKTDQEADFNAHNSYTFFDVIPI